MNLSKENAIHGDAPEGKDVPAAPCIFCGLTIEHFNDGGVGWLGCATVEGETRYFLYCDQPPCDAAKAANVYPTICACGDTVIVYPCPECGAESAPKEED